MSPSAALRFDGISRRFGALRVLRGVAGEVRPGELLVVSGSNGCGKSTLLRCLAGLLRPDAGTIEIEVAGERTTDAALRRSALGYLAPDVAFYDELTVAENLRFFARLRGVDAAPALAFATALGLPADRPAGVLSSGMRQRLRWAWAELAAPKLLLLDEPFQNLDADGASRIREHLGARLAAGAAAIVATPERLHLPKTSEEPRELRLDG